MTISGKALNRLAAAFPDLRRCKGLLVIPPTEHILRCFTFERTPYKGTFYFWGVVWPLYHQWPILMGERLANCRYIDLSEAAFESSIDLLVDVVRNELDGLRSVRTPMDLLDQYGGERWREGETRMGAFLAAMTYYLVGEIPFCLSYLDDIASDDFMCIHADFRNFARDFAADIRVDPAAGLKKIQTLEAANIEYFGLAPTVRTGTVGR
jgi:hypothetical protein